MVVSVPMYLFSGQLSASEERVQVSLEELQDLKGVWSELSKIWDQIDELKEKPWLSVQPRKVSNHLCRNCSYTSILDGTDISQFIDGCRILGISSFLLHRKFT